MVLGDLGVNTAVSCFVDTAVFGVYCASIKHRPRYHIFKIPRYSGFSGRVSVRDRDIAFLAYRGLLPFLGFCNVKCSVLGWGSEGLSGWFRGTV